MILQPMTTRDGNRQTVVQFECQYLNVSIVFYVANQNRSLGHLRYSKDPRFVLEDQFQVVLSNPTFHLPSS